MADLHDDSIKTSLWRISAHDRINSLSNTSAFSVDIPSGVESFRNVIAIQLISATIPTSHYNIDTYDLTQSDPTLEFWYNGVPITLVIPRGQYVLSLIHISEPTRPY